MITQKLKREGVKIYIDHKTQNLSPSADLVIYSTAVNENNLEIKKSKKLGIPIKSYAQALGDLTKRYKTIAVAGAHGKSTTTALLSLVLIKAGLDPTVIIGTNLKEFGNKNFRSGKNNYLILEADEYHQSFLNYSPVVAIITNIDREHLDYYKNLSAIKNVFLKFIKNIRHNGILVINKDDKNLFNLKNKIQKIAKNNNLKVFWYSVNIAKSKLSKSDFQKLKKILKIPGQHNLSNALAVYTLARALGINQKKIFNAISCYRGAWRRMEYRGKLKIQNSKFKISVYDDYAHHPTEIKTTLSGIAQKWSKSTLICVFQPHQAQRLSLLFRDFVRAFDEANALILLPVYQVVGRDILYKLSQNRGCCNENKFRRKTSQIFCNNKIVAKYLSKKLAEAIQKRIVNLKPKPSNLKTVIYLPHPKKLPTVFSQIINASCFMPHASCIIVMMGAGDIYKMTDNLIK